MVTKFQIKSYILLFLNLSFQSLFGLYVLKKTLVHYNLFYSTIFFLFPKVFFFTSDIYFLVSFLHKVLVKL